MEEHRTEKDRELDFVAGGVDAILRLAYVETAECGCELASHSTCSVDVRRAGPWQNFGSSGS